MLCISWRLWDCGLFVIEYTLFASSFSDSVLDSTFSSSAAAVLVNHLRSPAGPEMRPSEKLSYPPFMQFIKMHLGS